MAPFTTNFENSSNKNTVGLSVNKLQLKQTLFPPSAYDYYQLNKPHHKTLLLMEKKKKQML